jgi:glycosyltransferase involved in cell wall biosynthesis
VDLLIAPAAATELALLPPTSAPVVYVTDATFALLHGYYAAFSDLGPRSVREANAIERAALHRATVIVYPSEWAADSAVRDYGVPREKIHVVPFGANLTMVPTADEATRDRADDAINLVLVGVDWVRKGCDIAVAAVATLRAHGANARLTIVGCSRAPRAPEFVDVIPYLDKWKPEQAGAYREILLRSHAMILPTRADCSSIAAAEANAHGVPAMLTDTGGVRGMVTDGVNGALMPADAGPLDWADAVMRLVGDRARHREMCRSARATFDSRLNWDCWADALRSIVAGLRAT